MKYLATILICLLAASAPYALHATRFTHQAHDAALTLTTAGQHLMQIPQDELLEPNLPQTTAAEQNHLTNFGYFSRIVACMSIIHFLFNHRIS